MTRLDRYRMSVAVVLLALGVIVIIRAIDSGVWPVGIVGLLMVSLGLYRLNQFRNYRRLIRR